MQKESFALTLLPRSSLRSQAVKPRRITGSLGIVEIRPSIGQRIRADRGPIWIRKRWRGIHDHGSIRRPRDDKAKVIAPDSEVRRSPENRRIWAIPGRNRLQCEVFPADSPR